MGKIGRSELKNAYREISKQVAGKLIRHERTERKEMVMNRTFDKLSEDWKGLNKLVLFGFGKMGQGNIEAFINRFQVVKIIDNNKALNGQNYHGIEIIDLETYVSMNIKEKIVVVTSGNGYDSISKELEKKDIDNTLTFVTS